MEKENKIKKKIKVYPTAFMSEAFVSGNRKLKIKPRSLLELRLR